MAQPFGIVLAASAIAVTNEILLDPAAHGDTPSLSSFNWRIVPATLVLGALLQGMNSASPPFARGLAYMTVLAVLLIPVNTEKASALENVATLVNKPPAAPKPAPAKQPKKGKTK